MYAKKIIASTMLAICGIASSQVVKPVVPVNASPVNAVNSKQIISRDSLSIGVDASVSSKAPTIAFLSQIQKAELDATIQKRIDMLNPQPASAVTSSEKAAITSPVFEKKLAVIERKINTVVGIFGPKNMEQVEVKTFDGKILTLRLGMGGPGFVVSRVGIDFAMVDIFNQNKLESKKVLTKKISKADKAKPENSSDSNKIATVGLNKETTKFMVRVGESFESF